MPGARAPLIASALGSLPIGMYILAIRCWRARRRSFAERRVAGAFGGANALGAVAQGRLMDRLGRRACCVAAPHAPAITALVIAAERRAPSAVLAPVRGGGRRVPAAGPRRHALAVERAGRGRGAATRGLRDGGDRLEVLGGGRHAAGARGIAAVTPGRGDGRRRARSPRAPRSPSPPWRVAALARRGACDGWLEAAGGARRADRVRGHARRRDRDRAGGSARVHRRGSAETGGLLLAALSAGSLAGSRLRRARGRGCPLAIRLALMLAALAGGCPCSPPPARTS